jgi:hypothetical protein
LLQRSNGPDGSAGLAIGYVDVYAPDALQPVPLLRREDRLRGREAESQKNANPEHTLSHINLLFGVN